MTAARIARRMVRKLVKPIALKLAERSYDASEAEAQRLLAMREDIIALVTAERLRQVQMIMRRNQIAGW